MWFNSRHPMELPAKEDALPGRSEPILAPGRHIVLGTPLAPPYPEGTEVAEFALGCFWGAERKFWEAPGAVVTAVGYEGGFTPNPTYEEVCSGRTGHAEAVRVVFDPKRVSYDDLLRVFWEDHDPTQGMRQGNDAGTQYRSVIFAGSKEQASAAEASRARFQQALTAAGADTPTRLLYSSRSLDDVIYREELARLAGNGCEIVHTLTRAQPPGWTGHARRVDRALLEEVAWPAAEHPLAYVCGPTSFVETAASLLVELGYDPRRIKTERFGATGG